MKSVRWAVALLIVITVAIAVALAFRGGGATPAAEATAAATVTPSRPEPQAPADTTPTQVVAGMLTVARTADADAYADSVAAFVFSMDPRVLDPEDYRTALLDEADPLMSDTGATDLELMVDEQLPDATQWARMRANQQWSTWSATAVWEPQTWAEVVTDGLAEPGWVLRNVTGIQTTSYVDGGQDRTAVSEPTLTVGMRCPAPGAAVDRCHLTMIGTVVIP